MDMDDPKKKFLLHIFFSNSVFSAFAQRGKGKDGRKRGVYQPFPDTKRKEKFKDFLREFLEKYVDIKWRGKKQLSSAELEDCMDKLKEEVDEGFSDILNKDNESKITFGTVQKLVNLYLKYLWCTSQIDFDPPHCPVDGQVLGKIDWDGPLWPDMQKGDYQRAIMAITGKARKKRYKSVAEWELEEWPSQNKFTVLA